MHEHIEKKLEQKARRRQFKRKPKMKISGRSVIQLKQLIAEKTSLRKRSN